MANPRVESSATVVTFPLLHHRKVQILCRATRRSPRLLWRNASSFCGYSLVASASGKWRVDNERLRFAGHLPPATCHLPLATCHSHSSLGCGSAALAMCRSEMLTQVAVLAAVLHYLEKEAKCPSMKRLSLGESRWIGIARIESMGKEFGRWQ